MPLAAGDKLGPYEILGPLGAGGMGQVYRARDTRLGRDVAIKISAAQFTDRFEREARAVAALNHPNICHLYDVGALPSGSGYLVMELIEGQTLTERIRQGPLPLEEALHIAAQIRDALEAAHEKLITHRDLKPGNVMITSGGSSSDNVVKVLDFGLAKQGREGTVSGSDVPHSPTLSPTLSMAATEAGMILGTAAYMSPEQAKGRQVDKRADIWAFGVVLYEMLTGERPFHGEDAGDILASVIKEQPNFDKLPAKVRPLIESCLEKDPKKRLRDIGDAWKLLGSFQPAAAPALPSRFAGRFGWITAGVAALLLIAVTALAFVHFRETPPVVQSLRYQLTLPDNAVFYMFQLSPDGRYLAYKRQSGKPNTLFVRAMDSLDEREIPGTDAATYPFWSPDSTHIAFFAQGKLKQVALSGGPATNIADAPDSRGGTWGPDGTIVFAPTVNGGLFRVSPSNGGPATPLKLPPVANGDSLRFPAFLPDSRRFFYDYDNQGVTKPELAGLYVGFLDGTPPVRILPDESSARFVPSSGSSTSGYLLFRRDTTLMAQPFDAAALKATGEAVPLADPIPDSGNVGNAAFTVASNGTLLYLVGGIASQEREIAWLDRGGKRGKSLLKQKGIGSFALSPDGAQVVYSVTIPNGSGDLWLHDVAHGTTQRFTFGPFRAGQPEWSPDSASVVFSALPGYELYRKATQTSAKEESLGVRGTNTFATGWSGDGKLLVYSRTGDATKDDLWLLPVADQEKAGDRKPKLFKQTPFNETGGRISPDGRWMAYNSDASGQYEIYIEPMPAGGAPRQISVGGGHSAVWRKDGRELYFVSGNKLMAVDVKPGAELTFGTPHELFSGSNLIAGNRLRAVYPNADGSQFLALLPAGDAPAAPPLTVVTNWQAGLKK